MIGDFFSITVLRVILFHALNVAKKTLCHIQGEKQQCCYLTVVYFFL